MELKTTIIYELHRKYRDDLLALYHGVEWALHRTDKNVDIILEHSSFCVGIVESESDKLIAFSRVLTDYFKFSYVYDVIVDPQYRGHGLGKQLIERIIHHPSMQNIQNIELVCRKDMMPFYAQFGFTNDYGGSVSMRLQRSLVQEHKVLRDIC